MTNKVSRTTIGYVEGRNGQFARHPFYSVELPLSQCGKLENLLMQSDAEARGTVTLAVSYQQPDRLRLKRDRVPNYETILATNYVRGDMLRVQGKELRSCNLAITARFGIPALRQQLHDAAERSRDFVLMRIPSRNHDIVEFDADVDLADRRWRLPAEVIAGTAAAATILGQEDFSDWEKESKPQ